MVENKKVIAVDIGGSNLRVSIVKNGRILKYVKETLLFLMISIQMKRSLSTNGI